MTTEQIPLDAQIPEKALVVLIGASGAGKTTLASTWPAFQVLSLDALRGWMSDDEGCQEATDDAVEALHLLVERRMARRLHTVVDATNVAPHARGPLVAAAQRHGMPVIAVLLRTPQEVCLARQIPRPANRTVPNDTVRAQHAARVACHQALRGEGFTDVVFAENLHRLEPLLHRLSQAHEAELRRDGGLGELLLIRATFGREILSLWRWKEEPGAADEDRIAEIRLGPLCLTLRRGRSGAAAFEVMGSCPVDPECRARAWAPAPNVTSLYRALTGSPEHDRELSCTIHGPGTGHQSIAPGGPDARAERRARYTAALPHPADAALAVVDAEQAELNATLTRVRALADAIDTQAREEPDIHRAALLRETATRIRAALTQPPRQDGRPRTTAVSAAAVQAAAWRAAAADLQARCPDARGGLELCLCLAADELLRMADAVLATCPAGAGQAADRACTGRLPVIWDARDPLMAAIAQAVWTHCTSDGHSTVVDDPRNIAAAAAQPARTVLARTKADQAPQTAPSRRLSPQEHDAAWHTIKSAVREPRSDPARVLADLLHALGIDAPKHTPQPS
ncbi:ATP-binding protein [Streptomyces sp. MNP-20]|uniref:ATP-binding protein n=1 Tax=Streptomyces sp. MNP-20 TaxID=2721165 RepID=UPI001553F264|nr:ATP-binding protein [Streptomyces sp. MNP-20]